MILISILLALLLEHFASHYRDASLHETGGGLLSRLRSRMPAEWLWQSPLWPAFMLLLPTLLVAVLQGLIGHSLLRVPVDVVVLFLCLGPRDLGDDVHRLIAARESGDGETVGRLTRLLKRGAMPDTDQRSLLGALFIQSHERLFGALIWFIVVGPAGAVLYRIASRLPRIFVSLDGQAVRFVRYVHSAAAWLPARLTALLYGVAGSTDDALRAWRVLPTDQSWSQHTWALLAEVPCGALDMELRGARMAPPSLEVAMIEVLRMQRRALLLLLAIFALYSAGAWLA